ncbi:MAG: hypothetical protein QM784_07530 [Polyangiaceae bacterium]
MVRLRFSFALLASSFLALGACSGGAKPAQSADDTANSEAANSTTDDKGDASGDKAKSAKVEDHGWDDVEQKDVSGDQKGARKKDAPTTSSNSVKDNPEPDFKEGGSVDDAIKAVPQGLPRENLEQEALDKPLLNVDLYEPCKLTPSSHFRDPLRRVGRSLRRRRRKDDPKESKTRNVPP